MQVAVFLLSFRWFTFSETPKNSGRTQSGIVRGCLTLVIANFKKCFIASGTRGQSRQCHCKRNRWSVYLDSAKLAGAKGSTINPHIRCNVYEWISMKFNFCEGCVRGADERMFEKKNEITRERKKISVTRLRIYSDNGIRPQRRLKRASVCSLTTREERYLGRVPEHGSRKRRTARRGESYRGLLLKRRNFCRPRNRRWGRTLAPRYTRCVSIYLYIFPKAHEYFYVHASTCAGVSSSSSTSNSCYRIIRFARAARNFISYSGSEGDGGGAT